MIRNRNRWIAVIAAVLSGMLALAGCGAPPQGEAAKPQTVDRATQQQLDKLNEMADRFYQHVSAGDVVEARNTLKSVQTAMTEIRFAGVTSPEGVQALNETVTQGARVFDALKFSMEDGQVAAAKIRLATDALTHPEKPMWLQYYRILQEDLTTFERKVLGREGGKLQASLAPVYNHYSVVRPAALISRPPTEVVKVDSLFTFLTGQTGASELNYSELSRGVTELGGALDVLFQKKDETAYVPMAEAKHPIYWAMGLGSVILLALAYTAWKMIQYERSAFGSSRRRP